MIIIIGYNEAFCSFEISLDDLDFNHWRKFEKEGFIDKNDIFSIYQWTLGIWEGQRSIPDRYYNLIISLIKIKTYFVCKFI